MPDLDAVIRAPLAFASSVRFLHTRGVVAEGHGELGAHWWPVQGRVPVTARFSRGIGLPGLMPDLLDLAVRFHFAAGPWDVLLATAQLSTRVVPLPAASWARARFSSVTAFRVAGNDTPMWVLAEPEPGQPRTGSLGALVGGDPPHFNLSLAPSRGAAVPAGRLSLDPPTTEQGEMQPAFDPVRNLPDGVSVVPEWLAVARRAVYGGSSAGHDANEATTSDRG